MSDLEARLAALESRVGLGRQLAELAEVRTGIWEMTPGTAHDVENDEVFVVLAGADRGVRLGFSFLSTALTGF